MANQVLLGLRWFIVTVDVAQEVWIWSALLTAQKPAVGLAYEICLALALAISFISLSTFACAFLAFVISLLAPVWIVLAVCVDVSRFESSPAVPLKSFTSLLAAFAFALECNGKQMLLDLCICRIRLREFLAFFTLKVVQPLLI